VCAYCGCIKKLFCRYTKHLRLYHECVDNFSVVCNIIGCKDSFTKVRCFVRHVHRKHKSRPTLSQCQSTCDTDGNAENSVEMLDEISVNDTVDAYSDTDENDATIPVAKSVADFGKHVASCVLKLREKHILPVSVVQDIVDEMKFMVSYVHDYYSAAFKTLCSEHNISFPDDSVARVLSSDTSVYSNVFDSISSNYKLCSLIRKNFIHVQPLEITLAHKDSKTVTFQYIRISDVLKLVLSNNAVLCHILIKFE